MKDKYGELLKFGNLVEVYFYSYEECITSCICRVTIDEKLEIVSGSEPLNYYYREMVKLN